VITDFLKRAYAESIQGVLLSVDVFGRDAWQRPSTCRHRPGHRRDAKSATYSRHDLSSHFFAMDGYDHPGRAEHFIGESMDGSPHHEDIHRSSGRLQL